ncbi:hypothetical protein HMPREF9141_0474 [Prevotella multiformis DSM 16608]|uniref:Uncharacterized protein n=1 Tax=Prevotella multiformis DSM 16608 TaxID=888743 RepID=F0F4F8_9BACT|nr:hypothetical protein HMPREF9141_0474 [Prevotella multiformis DSM 16608]
MFSYFIAIFAMLSRTLYDIVFHHKIGENSTDSELWGMYCSSETCKIN